MGGGRGGGSTWAVPGPAFRVCQTRFILALAHFLSRPVEELRVPLNFWKALGLMMLPFVLILKEPDLGSALVLLPAGLAMLFVAGTPRRFLAWMFACVGILGALFVANVLFAPPNWQIKLEDYQRRRLLVYFSKDSSACPCVEGGTGTPAQATIGRLAQCAAGVNLRRLGRADGQRLAAGHAECPRVSAAESGAQ